MRSRHDRMWCMRTAYLRHPRPRCSPSPACSKPPGESSGVVRRRPPAMAGGRDGGQRPCSAGLPLPASCCGARRLQRGHELARTGCGFAFQLRHARWTAGTRMERTRCGRCGCRLVRQLGRLPVRRATGRSALGRPLVAAAARQRLLVRRHDEPEPGRRPVVVAALCAARRRHPDRARLRLARHCQRPAARRSGSMAARPAADTKATTVMPTLVR